MLPSDKVSFDAERNAKGHADKFWAVALACQKEREPMKVRTGEIGVRVVGARGSIAPTMTLVLAWYSKADCRHVMHLASDSLLSQDGTGNTWSYATKGVSGVPESQLHRLLR